MATAAVRQLRCHVCGSSFKHGGPQPYLLPCLHSVCDKCLASDASEELTCTNCQETFSKKDSEFPKDAVTTKEAFLSSVESSPLQILCSNREDGNQAMAWCQECEAFLCEHCQASHEEMKISRDHVVVSMTDFTKSQEGMNRSIVFCKDHPYHPLELFDLTCGKIICYKCLKENHQTCKTEDTTKTFECLKDTELPEGARRLAAKLVDIDEVESKVEDLSGQLDTNMKTVRETVQHTFTDLRNTLSQREEEVLLQLDKCFKAVRDTNEERLATISQERSRCTAAMQFIEKCLELSSHVDLLQMKKTIESRTTFCEKNDLPRVRKEESCINYSRIDLKDLKEFIATFGEFYSSIPENALNQLPNKVCDGRITSLMALQKKNEQKISQLESHLKLCAQKFRKLPKLIDQNPNARTIKLKVEGIADQKGTVNSGKCFIKNIPWHLSLQVTSARPPKKHGVFLYCGRKDGGKWSCEVRAEFRVVQQTKNGTDHCRPMTATFDRHGGLGFDDFISMDILHPQRGYIANGAITIEADVTVKSTTGICDPLAKECSLPPLPLI